MSQPIRNTYGHIYEFGPFRLDPQEHRLSRDGQVVSLSPKIFDLLLALVRQHGHLIEKNALLGEVWPDSVVEEGNLNRNISTLRKALGEEPSEMRYIETIPRVGYRFVAEVREVRMGDNEAISQPRAIQSQSRRKIAGAVALAIVLIAAVSFAWFASRKPAGDKAAVKSIAVLPFKPLDSDGRDEYLGLGMADTLITKLSGLRSLIVRPTSAVRKYAGPTQDPLAAGHEQRVDAVLDANLQRDGERIRVTARLLNVKDGAALWAYQCDEQYCADIFKLQDAISEKIAFALAAQLSGAERKLLQKHHTENKEAHQLYLKGRFYWHIREDTEKAIKCFQQAIDLDPNYALAYSGLADCYVSQGRISPKEYYAKARAAAVKALEIDGALAEAHVSFGSILHNLDWDWSGAEREFKQAVDLNPNYVWGRFWYAMHLNAMGRFDEAIAEIRRALELDPTSHVISLFMGDIFFCSRQYDRAIEQYLKTLEMHPNDRRTHISLGEAYALKGMREKAIASLEKAAALADSAQALAALGWGYAMAGKREEAQKALDQLSEMSKRKPVRPTGAARIHAALGDRDRAFELLEKAYLERVSAMDLLKVDPRLDGLRQDPRFQDLLRRMRLSQYDGSSQNR
jgi:DNA-binding winged helix-turn-helix (wHTH) protein/Tfp pilus assembly protein PilF